jgi:hypothetical protein
MKITAKQIRNWGSCYSDERLAAIFGAAGLTPREIASLERVPLCDRRHALIRVLIHCTHIPITDFSGWCALRAYYATSYYATYAAYYAAAAHVSASAYADNAAAAHAVAAHVSASAHASADDVAAAASYAAIAASSYASYVAEEATQVEYLLELIGEQHD